MIRLYKIKRIYYRFIASIYMIAPMSPYKYSDWNRKADYYYKKYENVNNKTNTK